MIKEYHTKKRCKYMLKLHIILVTKYRKPILVGDIDNDVKQIIYEISKMQDSLFTIESMETDENHIHILADIDPTVSATSIISRIKQVSTNRMWKKYKEELKIHYWNENTLWSDGYFVCSIGDANMQTIKKYIEEQG